MPKIELIKNNKFSIASLLLFICVYIFAFFMNLTNILDFGASYDEAVNLTSYADTNVYLIYDDILCQNIRRIEMEGMNEVGAAAYFNECLPALCEIYTGNFISTAIIYTFLAFSFLQYFLYKKNELYARKHYRSVVLCNTLCCVVYIGIVFFALLAKGFVMTLHTPNIIFILVCQFLVMLSASVVYAWVIRRIRFKKIAAFMLIILSVIFYYGGILSELNLGYAIGGITRVALILGEAVNPLANINRFGFDMDGESAVWITLLYMAKSTTLLVLIGYSFYKEDLLKKNKNFA